jgi:hypothetical protein
MAYGALVHNQTRYRRLLGAARLAGYTYMRIWGGGNIEVRVMTMSLVPPYSLHTTY